MILSFLFALVSSQDCLTIANKKFTEQLTTVYPKDNCISVVDCLFSSISSPDANGGAILLEKMSTVVLYINYSVFDSCSSGKVGGALYLQLKSPYIDSCCFSKCTAINASMMYILGDYHSSFIINLTTMMECEAKEFYGNYVEMTEFSLRFFNATKNKARYASVAFGFRAQFYEGYCTTFVENSDGGEIAFVESDIQLWFRWFYGNFVNNTYRDENCYMLTASTSWLFWDSVFNGNGDRLFDIIDTFACHLIRCYFDCVPHMEHITLGTLLPYYSDVFNTSAPTNLINFINTFDCAGNYSVPERPNYDENEGKVKIPIVIGGAIGAFAVGAIIIGIVWFFFRSKKTANGLLVGINTQSYN